MKQNNKMKTECHVVTTFKKSEINIVERGKNGYS